MAFEKIKFEQQSLDWGREAEEWAKARVQQTEKRKEGDFLITEKVLATGVKVVVKRWSGSKKLAEVVVYLIDGEVKVYRAHYEQGNAHWTAVSGGEPKNFPEEIDPWQEKMF